MGSVLGPDVPDTHMGGYNDPYGRDSSSFSVGSPAWVGASWREQAEQTAKANSAAPNITYTGGSYSGSSTPMKLPKIPSGVKITAAIAVAGWAFVALVRSSLPANYVPPEKIYRFPGCRSLPNFPLLLLQEQGAPPD